MVFVKKVFKNRDCIQCGASYMPKRDYQTFCSAPCRTLRDTERYQMLSVGRAFGIPTATVGAIAELRVAADLMARGFHVFRALSAACPCDLYAFKTDSEHLRIEVRTAYRRHPDKPIYVTRTPRQPYGYDILAAVLPDTIIYEPPFEN